MNSCISSLDIYAHPFNHRFFERGSDSDISTYHQGSQPDSLMFLPFNFDFTTGTLSQLEDEANPEIGMEVFGIAEEIALAVFEGSEDLFEDISSDARSGEAVEAVEVKEESLTRLATSTNLPASPTCYLCSSVTPPAPCHHLHQENSQHTCSSDNSVSPTSPWSLTGLTCERVACEEPKTVE